MAVYINQIKKRRELEKVKWGEVMDRGAQRLGFRRKKRVVPQDDQSALRQILDALEVKDYELDEDDMLTPEEQLTGILRPRGIMMRRIRLTGEWWRECVGPLLGYTKDGHLAVLTPTSTGLGYRYKDHEGLIRTLGRQEMEDHLKPTAIIFTKALPLHALKVKDLITFAWSVVSGPNAFLLLVAALVVVLLGMFTPMANKLIFDTVIPTGDAVDLLPITGLLIGATVGTMLLTLTRNLYITRVQHIVDLHTHNAIMARTFLLSPTFFSKNASGELTEKITNLATLCSMINETIIGACLTGVLSLIYFMQLWLYGRSLLLPAFGILAFQIVVLWLNYRRTERIQGMYIQKAAKLSGLEYNMYNREGEKILTYRNAEHTYGEKYGGLNSAVSGLFGGRTSKSLTPDRYRLEIFKSIVNEFRKDFKEIQDNYKENNSKSRIPKTIGFKGINLPKNVGGDEYSLKSVYFTMKNSALKHTGLKVDYDGTGNARYFVQGNIGRYSLDRHWVDPYVTLSDKLLSEDKTDWYDGDGNKHTRVIRKYTTEIVDHHGYWQYTATVDGSFSLVDDGGRVLLTHSSHETDDKTADAYRHLMKDFYKKVNNLLGEKK